MNRILSYFKNLLIALDQFLGALFLGNDADITISAQAWLWHIQGKCDWPYRLIDAIFWLDEVVSRIFRTFSEAAPL